MKSILILIAATLLLPACGGPALVGSWGDDSFGFVAHKDNTLATLDGQPMLAEPWVTQCQDAGFAEVLDRCGTARWMEDGDTYKMLVPAAMDNEGQISCSCEEMYGKVQGDTLEIYENLDADPIITLNRKP